MVPMLIHCVENVFTLSMLLFFTTMYTILRVNDFNNEYKLYFMSYVLLYKT